MSAMAVYREIKKENEIAVQVTAYDIERVVKPYLAEIGGPEARGLFDALVLASTEPSSGITRFNYSLLREGYNPRGALFSVGFASGPNFSIRINEASGRGYHNVIISHPDRNGFNPRHEVAKFDTKITADWADQAARVIFEKGSDTVREELAIRRHAELHLGVKKAEPVGVR